MKQAAYFQRAFEDPAFRREQIDNLTYFKKVDVGLIVVIAVFGLVFTGLAGLEHGSAWLGMLLFSGLSWVELGTRLAALEAIEQRTGRPTPKAGLIGSKTD